MLKDFESNTIVEGIEQIPFTSTDFDDSMKNELKRRALTAANSIINPYGYRVSKEAESAIEIEQIQND